MLVRILIAITIEAGCGGSRHQRCDPPSKVMTEPRELPRPPLVLGGLTLGQRVDDAKAACLAQGGAWTSGPLPIAAEAGESEVQQPAARTVERFIGDGWNTLCLGPHGVVGIRADVFGRVLGIRAAIARPASGRFAYARQKLLDYEAVLGESSTPGDLSYCTEHDLCGQPPYDQPTETWGEITLRAVTTDGELDLELIHHDSALAMKTWIGDAACRP